MSDRRPSDERRRSPPRSLSRSRSPVNGRRESRYRSRSPSRDHVERDYQDEDVNPGDNLFVTGLSLNTTNTALEDLFSKHGAVQKVEIMYDPHTRESRGFGFIQMHSSDEAERALESVNGMEVDGRVITVEKAKRSKARTPTPGRYYGPPKRQGRPGMDRMDPRDYRYRESRYDRPPRGYDRPFERYVDRYDYYDRYDRDRNGGGGGSAGGDRYGSRYNDRYSDRYSDRDRYDRRPPPPRYDPYPRPRSPY